MAAEALAKQKEADELEAKAKQKRQKALDAQGKFYESVKSPTESHLKDAK